MKKKFCFITLIAFFICFFAGLCGLPLINAVSLSARKNQSQKYYLNAAKLKHFEISYTHSVNKGRVTDFYSINSNNNLMLFKTRFVSYGAGIPELEDFPGAVFAKTSSGYEISGIDREIPRLVMAVGLIAEHKIVFFYSNETLLVPYEYELKSLFAPQTSIIIELKKVSLADYILNKVR